MPQAPSSPPPPISAANDVLQGQSLAQWAALVQQLGAEVAGPLGAALERIQDLSSTGQIDRQGLRALREAVAQARAAGMVGQQLARLASGRLNASRERLHLTQMLRSVLAQRSRETQARGIQVRQMLKPIEVMGDGPLLFSLLNALMDWALASTHSAIDLQLGLTSWPAKARLSCRFASRPPEFSAEVHSLVPRPQYSLIWRLVEQTAIAMGVLPLREDESGVTVLTLEFPHTLGEDEPLGSDLDRAPEPPFGPAESIPASGFAHSANSKPLAGSHLLIVTARSDLRRQIHDAVRHMGLIIDAVNTVGEAAQFCLEGLPHGLIVEAGQRGPQLDALRRDIWDEVADFSFIEVLDQEQQTQLSTATADGVARVARVNLSDALPSMLLFEFSKAHG